MFCPHCGVQVPDGAAYCQKCGRALPNGEASYQNSNPTGPIYQEPQTESPTPPIQQNQAQPQYAPPQGQYTAPQYAPAAPAGAPMQVYAGFWLRFVAIIIDGIILGIVGAVIGGIFGGGTSTDFLTFLIGWMYSAVMESSPQQATLGKQALGLVVTDLNGMQLTFGRATGRYFGKILSAITLLIGYIMAGFTAKKQALHDLVANTLVIKKDAQSYVQSQQI